MLGDEVKFSLNDADPGADDHGKTITVESGQIKAQLAKLVI
jgi:hypothetical protein